MLPAHRAAQLRRQQAGPLGAAVVGERVDVGDHRHLGVAWVGVGDRLAQPVARRRHERRVERAGHLQRHDLLGPELLGDGTGRGHAVGRAGDDDLTGRVEVGHPHVAVGPPAGDLDEVVVEPEDRGHRAGVVDAGLVHRVGPLDDEAHALVERQGTGGGERGVLAEAVAGAHRRFETEAFGGVEDHEAGDERGELGVARVAQRIGVGVEQQRGDVALGHLRRLVDQFPAVVIGPRATHPRALRALAGEREGKHDDLTVDPRMGSRV